MAASIKQINTLDFDKILEHVGPLGLWQFWQLLMLFFVGGIAGIAATTFAFTGKMYTYSPHNVHFGSLKNPRYAKRVLVASDTYVVYEIRLFNKTVQ